ncbi:MAG: hypothetical protein IKJ19_03100 [Clostridia bacterium]|nr:hypothetical protein [Clostridia bacterium]
MKKIKIFIGSSIIELKNDRIEIGNFFRQLNDLYLDNGLYFKLVMCEDYSDDINIEGKQSQYDKEILDSDLSIFIFYKQVGVYTEHEFELAYNNFKKELRPKILTVFKCANESNEIIEDVKFFADKLDKELKHYYKTYSNTDSLKLWLIMQIKSMGLDQSMVEFKGGKVLVNGESIAVYSNAPAFSNHEELAKLKKELIKVRSDYLKQKAEYLENPNDLEVYLKYSTSSKTKAEIEEKIKSAEDKIFTQLQNIYTIADSGNLSERQILGYRLIESGKYEQALAILDSDEIFSEVLENERLLEHGEAIVASAKANLQTSVNEILQRIETLKIKGVTKDSAIEIDELFAKACELCKKHSLDKKVFLQYSSFLHLQKQDAKELKLLEEVRELFEKLGTWEEKCDFWCLLGNNYLSSSNVFKGLECYDKAYKINSALCQLSPNEENLLNKAKLSYNISLAYGKNDSKDRAFEFAKESVEEFEKLFDINPKKYARRLSSAYTQLGWCFAENTKKAVYYKKAYEVLLARIEAGDANENEIADYVFAAKYYAFFNVRMNKCYKPASFEHEIIQNICKIAKELSDKNPARYDDVYAGVLFDMAKNIEDYANGVAFEEGLPDALYLQAIAIYQRVLAIDEYSTLYSYAYANGRLGKYYFSKGDERAKIYIQKAIESYQKIGEQNGRSPRVRAYQHYTVATYYLRYLKDYKAGALAYKRSLELYGEIENKSAEDVKWIGYINKDIEIYGIKHYLTEEENG